MKARKLKAGRWAWAPAPPELSAEPSLPIPSSQTLQGALWIPAERLEAARGGARDWTALQAVFRPHPYPLDRLPDAYLAGGVLQDMVLLLLSRGRRPGYPKRLHQPRLLLSLCLGLVVNRLCKCCVK